MTPLTKRSVFSAARNLSFFGSHMNQTALKNLRLANSWISSENMIDKTLDPCETQFFIRQSLSISVITYIWSSIISRPSKQAPCRPSYDVVILYIVRNQGYYFINTVSHLNRTYAFQAMKWNIWGKLVTQNLKYVRSLLIKHIKCQQNYALT